jgi:hypothetical protein
VEEEEEEEEVGGEVEATQAAPKRRGGARNGKAGRLSLMACIGTLEKRTCGKPLRATTLFALLAASRSRAYRRWLWRARQQRAAAQPR